MTTLAGVFVVFLLAVMAVLVWFFVEAWIFAIQERTTWLIALLAVSTCAVTISHFYCFYVMHTFGLNMWDTTAAEKEEPRGVTEENKKSFCLFQYSSSAAFAPRGASVELGYRCVNASASPKNAAAAPAAAPALIAAPASIAAPTAGRLRSGTGGGGGGGSGNCRFNGQDVITGEDADALSDCELGGMPEISEMSENFHEKKAEEEEEKADEPVTSSTPSARGKLTPGTSGISAASGVSAVASGSFCAGDLQDMCSICLGEYEDAEDVVLLPCAHMFHNECLAMWIKDHSTCPFCKAELNTRDAEPSWPRRAWRASRRFLLTSWGSSASAAVVPADAAVVEIAPAAAAEAAADGVAAAAAAEAAEMAVMPAALFLPLSPLSSLLVAPAAAAAPEMSVVAPVA